MDVEELKRGVSGSGEEAVTPALADNGAAPEMAPRGPSHAGLEAVTSPEGASLAGAESSSTQKSGAKTRTWLDELLETLLMAAVLFFLINVFTGRYQVLSISMEPTLHEGEYIIALKASYWFADPQRGDVVVFRPLPTFGSVPYIKRVIGVPGDEIEARDGRIWVNGTPLDEPYLAQPVQYTGHWSVPDGAYFVLGDNRNNSSDSHVWGTIPRANIIARAVFRYWPFSRLGVIQHYTYSLKPTE